VDEQGRAIGLVSVTQMQALARHLRAEQLVGEIADRDPGLLVSGDEDVSRLLERPAFARVGRAVVVDEPGRPMGLISITDVQRTLRAAQLADRPAGGRAPAAVG